MDKTNVSNATFLGFARLVTCLRISWMRKKLAIDAINDVERRKKILHAPNGPNTDDKMYSPGNVVIFASHYNRHGESVYLRLLGRSKFVGPTINVVRTMNVDGKGYAVSYMQHIYLRKRNFQCSIGDLASSGILHQ